MTDIKLDLGWNKENVKTIYMSPEGMRVQKEMSASEIIHAPNRHQMESVVKALTVAVSELIDMGEAQAKRILELHKQMEKKDEV